MVVEKKKYLQSVASEASGALANHGVGYRDPFKGLWCGSRGRSPPKLMDFSGDFSLKTHTAINFGLEIRLQIISQVDCNVCLKNSF